MFGANAIRMPLVAVAVLATLWLRDVGAFGFSTKGRGECIASVPFLDLRVVRYD